MKATEITYKGETITVPELARRYGYTPGQIYSRLQLGWSIEKAITTPMRIQQAEKFEYKGKMYSTAEISAMHGGINPSSVRLRLAKGMTVEEILNTPNRHPARKTAITAKKQKETIPLKARPKKVDTTQCKTCVYRAWSSGGGAAALICDYSGWEKHCRMFVSPPSPNCTVYRQGKSLARAAGLKRMHGK